MKTILDKNTGTHPSTRRESRVGETVTSVTDVTGAEAEEIDVTIVTWSLLEALLRHDLQGLDKGKDRVDIRNELLASLRGSLVLAVRLSSRFGSSVR